MRVKHRINRFHLAPMAPVVVALAVLMGGCAKKATPAASGGTTAAMVHTASVGSLGTVLEDAKGFTLYHNTQENNGQIVCTNQCASTWPPLLAPAGVSAPTGTGVSAQLGTIKRPDGSVQVTINGFPLYTYSGDSGPGQSNGQGISGVWFALTASGSDAKASGGGGGGGGGY